MSQKNAHIRKLKAENKELRSANRIMKVEKDKIVEAYEHLIKQIKQKEQKEQSPPCRFCQQSFSLTTISLSPKPVPSDSDGSSAFTPLSTFLTSTDTQPSPASTFSQLALSPKQRTSSNRHRGDRVVQPPLAHGNDRDISSGPSQGHLLAETSPRRNGNGQGRGSSSPTSSDISMHSLSDLAEESDIAAETEPDEQSLVSSSDSPSVETDGDHDDDSATSMDARKDIGSGRAGQEGSETPDAQQRGEVRLSSTSRINEELSGKVSPTLHHRKGPAGRRSNGAKFSTKTNTAAGRADPRKACSKSHSDTASEMSSASRSLESRVSHNATALGTQNLTTVVSNSQIRPNSVTQTVSAPAAARQTCEHPTYRGQEETDAGLKAAIRESYAAFALDGQRLKFCCEPLTLDPTAINLNTNWKQWSKLNKSLVERLLQMGSEISAFLPESDIERANQKDTELMRRVCTCKRPITASSSLKDVVRSLRRERDVTKDELNLIEFDLYSTLIIMRYQSENQASPPLRKLNDIIDNISQLSLRKQSQSLVTINAAFLACTTVCTQFLQI